MSSGDNPASSRCCLPAVGLDMPSINKHLPQQPVNHAHVAWALSVAVVLDDGSLLRRPKFMPSARSMPLNVRAVPGWLSVGVVKLGEFTGCRCIETSDVSVVPGEGYPL